tara:strand:+ start:36939 stop:37346 length:408 start_codon:yes stop_codon:yes gene_type:complete
MPDIKIPFSNIIIDHSIVRFFIVGVMNTSLDFAIFTTLYYGLEWNVAVANILAFCAALINSYTLNRKWSFSALPQDHKTEHQFILFTIVSLCTVALSTSIIVFGSVWLPVIILKLSTILLIPVLNYLSYKHIVFR